MNGRDACPGWVARRGAGKARSEEGLKKSVGSGESARDRNAVWPCAARGLCIMRFTGVGRDAAVAGIGWVSPARPLLDSPESWGRRPRYALLDGVSLVALRC